jgi:glycerate 2-kinase
MRSGESPRRVLVAADSFKGTFRSAEVNAAIAAAFDGAGWAAESLSVADGGEGTIEALISALGGTYRAAQASDPLGRAVDARWAVLGDGRAAVEVAEASGMWRVAKEERDAWAASTYGTGQLVAAAATAGAERVLVAAGGSATTDGGAGALRALEEAGTEVGMDVICDVATAWEDAPAVFGPQKGADPPTVVRLERRLDELAERAPRDPRGLPGTGCAGGLSGGLWAFRGARLLPGASFVLDAIGFDAHLPAADLVVTGEGRLDRQTLAGKVVAEIARRCRDQGVACCAIVGGRDLDDAGMRGLGVAGVWEASTLAEIGERARAIARNPPGAADAVGRGDDRRQRGDGQGRTAGLDA